MKYNCDFCGKEFYLKPSYLTKYKTHCCSKVCSDKLKQKLYKGEHNPNYKNRGLQSPLHKGAEIINSNGYIKIYKPDHPLCDKNGRILKHRYIAEKYIATENQKVSINGIKVLNSDLDVHHIDGNKLNNDISNLLVLTKQEHAMIHQNEKHKNSCITKKCLNCGNDFKTIKARKETAKFCCKECDKDFKAKNLITIVCPVCGKEFKCGKNENRRCCSVKCSNKFLNRGTVEFVCDFCGEKSRMKMSRFKKSKKHYCCNECYHKSKKK